ncbi:MAG: ChaN family lipoprotein [Candidatus Aminicenantes bacterium]
MDTKLAFVAALALSFTIPPLGQEPDARLRLPLGDPRFKDRTIEVAPGQIVSMETGSPIPFETMIREMRPAPFVLVGELHGALPAHELQERVVRALFEQDGRLAVGLEMVAAARQDTLTRWGRGLMTEEQFLRESRWYSAWGFHFAYYRPVLVFAKDHRIPLYALDTPQEVVGQFQMQGGQVLPGRSRPAAASLSPGPAEEEERLFLRTGLESSEMPGSIKSAVLDTMFEDLYRAQAFRETDMAARAVRAREHESRQVVVLVGSGHVMYGLGLSRRLRDMSGLPAKSVVTITVPQGLSSITVSRALADYIVGVPAEARPAYPEIELPLKTVPDPSKLVIARKPARGAALGLDLEENDLVLSVDGRAFADAEELLIYLAGIPRGGEARFRILRNGVERTVLLRI